jgi:hypothetical protein
MGERTERVKGAVVRRRIYACAVIPDPARAVAVDEQSGIAPGDQILGPLLFEGLDAIAAVEQDHGREGSRTLGADEQSPQRRSGLLLQLDPSSLGLLERKRGRRRGSARELDPLGGRRGGGDA